MKPLTELENLLRKYTEFCIFTENEEKRIPVLLFEIEKLDKTSEYFSFVALFNKATGLNFHGDFESRVLYYQGTGLYTNDERIKAVVNAKMDKWVHENPQFLNLKNFCKPEIIEKYANQYTPEHKANNAEIATGTEKNYRDVTL